MFAINGSQRFLPARISPKLWCTTIRSPITEDVSNNVSQWDDISGNGEHLIQGTGANQPTHTGNNIVFTAASSHFMTSTTDFFDNTNWTFFFAINCPNQTNGVLFADYGTSTNQVFAVNMQTGGVRYEVRDISLDNMVVSGQAYSASTNIFIGLRVDQAGQVIYTDTNGTDSTDTDAAYTTTDFSGGYTFHVGCANLSGTPLAFYQGNIMEVIIINSSISDTQRDWLEIYLQGEW